MGRHLLSDVVGLKVSTGLLWFSLVLSLCVILSIRSDIIYSYIV